MIKRYLIIITVTTSLFNYLLFGLTLQESVVEALNTNPVVQERIKNFRASQQDLNIAESDYYPKVDLRASSGYNSAGGIKDNIISVDYTNYESSLTLTQNIFNGFSTMNRVDYEEARILAAAYNYLEKVNLTAFEMSSAYLNVLRSYELLQISQEHVQINESMLLKVKDLYSSGLTTDSEVKKIQSTLSLSLSNLMVQKNNTRNAEYTFRRVLGRMPDVESLVHPDINISMPSSIERAALYAIENNPALLVSKYNIKSAQSQFKERKKEYLPKIDFEFNQFYNDSSVQNNGFDRPDDRYRASLVLSYNLFRGGADKADVQKRISIVNQEIELKRDLKRQVIETLDYGWTSYEMIGEQITYLRSYSQYSEKTLKLYEEEYDLGRRTLLDLLSAQNDFINSRSQIVSAEYDLLLAKFRVLDSMGLLVSTITGESNKFSSKVNLFSKDEPNEILDTINVELDVDHDNISDNLDLCDNSLKENNIMPYGCKKTQADSDGDTVSDLRDKCSSTQKGVKVSADGCALDTDKDGFKDYEDKCPNTPIGSKVDNEGCGLDSDMDGVKDYEDKCPNTPVGKKVNRRGCTPNA